MRQLALLKVCVGVALPLFPFLVTWPFVASGYRNSVEDHEVLNRGGIEAVIVAQKQREGQWLEASATELSQARTAYSWAWSKGGWPIWPFVAVELVIFAGLGLWFGLHVAGERVASVERAVSETAEIKNAVRADIVAEGGRFWCGRCGASVRRHAAMCSACRAVLLPPKPAEPGAAADGGGM